MSLKYSCWISTLSAVISLANIFAASSCAFADETCPSENFSHQSVGADHPKIGLALGGGGTRGYAHVGVLKVLQKAGIQIDCIAGTSMGAIVGGLYCAGVTPEEIQQKLLDESLMNSFISSPIAVRVAEAPVFMAPRLVGHKTYFGLFDGRKFLKFLNKAIPACEKDIATLPIPFRAEALNLVDGRVYDLDSGNLGLAMLASSAVPSLRQPVPIGDKLFIDGGILKNLPVDVAKKMGADIVIAVDVDENIKETPTDDFLKIDAVLCRVISLQLNAFDTVVGKTADILIHPDVDGIGLISRRKEDEAKAIKSGEEAALAALPAIKAAIDKATMAKQKVSVESSQSVFNDTK